MNVSDRNDNRQALASKSYQKKTKTKNKPTAALGKRKISEITSRRFAFLRPLNGRNSCAGGDTDDQRSEKNKTKWRHHEKSESVSVTAAAREFIEKKNDRDLFPDAVPTIKPTINNQFTDALQLLRPAETSDTH